MSKTQQKEFQLGTLSNFGAWTGIRIRLQNLFGCSLTPSLLSAGEEGWIVLCRAHKRMSKDDVAYLQGYFDALTSKIGR